MRSTACAALLLLLVTPLARGAGGEAAITWEEAGEHVGEEVTVEGRVVGVHCSPISCLLAFEPTFNRFTAAIQARSFEAFPPEEMDDRYSGKQVRVHGRVRLIDGKPEIVVESPEALTLVRDERKDKEGEAARASRSQGEILARLDELLARVEEIAERLAATEERLGAVLAALEQRDAVLASLQAPPPPPPPISGGEPAPRPAYETLRTIKRGMSPAEVERLVGPPERIDASGGGWTTWYYGYDRSVTFDARGRARSLVGFPAP